MCQCCKWYKGCYFTIMQKTPLMLKTHVQASIYQAKWIFLNFNSTGLQNVPHHYVLGVVNKNALNKVCLDEVLWCTSKSCLSSKPSSLISCTPQQDHKYVNEIAWFYVNDHKSSYIVYVVHHVQRSYCKLFIHWISCIG